MVSGAPEGWREETAASMVCTRRQVAARIAAKKDEQMQP